MDVTWKFQWKSGNLHNDINEYDSVYPKYDLSDLRIKKPIPNGWPWKQWPYMLFFSPCTYLISWDERKIKELHLGLVTISVMSTNHMEKKKP